MRYSNTEVSQGDQAGNIKPASKDHLQKVCVGSSVSPTAAQPRPMTVPLVTQHEIREATVGFALELRR
jgi:hypothetical protein